MTIETTLDEIVVNRRWTCCGGERKPCPYHEGMEDGIVLTLHTVKSAPVLDVSDWLAGA